MTAAKREAVVQRAIRAWLRECKREGWIPEQPSRGSGFVSEDVIELHNARGPLATYKYSARADRLRRVQIAALEEVTS